jgi:signal peptidase II
MHSAWRWFALAAGLVVADQVTKAVVLGRFAPGERLEVTGFFNLVLVCNPGAAFSLFASAGGWQTPLLIAFALVAIGVVGTMIVKRPTERIMCAALALVLGGALGNVIDRVRFGCVADFLDFHAGGWHWPAFNVADSAITVGAVLLIFEGFFHREGRARSST